MSPRALATTTAQAMPPAVGRRARAVGDLVAAKAIMRLKPNGGHRLELEFANGVEASFTRDDIAGMSPLVQVLGPAALAGLIAPFSLGVKSAADATFLREALIAFERECVVEDRHDRDREGNKRLI